MSTTRRRVKVRCVVCGTRYKVDTSSESSVRRGCPCGGELVPDDGSTRVGTADELVILEDAPAGPAAAGTLPGDAGVLSIPRPAPDAPDDSSAMPPPPAALAHAPSGSGLKWVILLLAAAAAGWWIWRIVEVG
jgi:hypothetical protein